MRSRYKYALAASPVGLLAAGLMILPLMVMGTLYLKANPGQERQAYYVCWLALAMFALLPVAAGYAIGRKKETAAQRPRLRHGRPTPLQRFMGVVGAVLAAVFAIIGVVGLMIFVVYVLPGLWRLFEAAPALVLKSLPLVWLVVVALAGWGGYRLGSSLGERS